MDTVKDFNFKRKKYMPVLPRATGKPTVYIEGYPSENDAPMAATGFHGVQSLNLWLRWEDYIGNVRLLRPYLPDGTPITTSAEEMQLRKEAHLLKQKPSAGVKQKHGPDRKHNAANR